MMKTPKINLAPLLALIFAGHVHLHSVDIQPERSTGIVGGEAEISCEVEYGPNYEMTWDFNKVFVYIITRGGENYPLGTSKYFVHRTGMNFTLKVKDLSLEDGGEYICTSFTSEATALLVVLDTPSITLNPTAPVDGETAEVTCEARFGGPKKDLLLPDHYPNLKMHLEGSSSSEILTAKQTENVNEHYFMSLTKNLTVHARMNTRHITCEIGTAEPSMKRYSVAILNVLYPVRNIYITPDQEKYEVGDTISCIADSNPEAVYEWREAQGGTPIYGKWLNITESMIDENNWECVARNVINGEWFEKRRQRSFVTDSLAVTIAVDQPKSENNSSAVTIAVIVTVLIAILVIIAAVALYFRKKMKKPKGSSTKGNTNDLQELGSVEAEQLLPTIQQEKDGSSSPEHSIEDEKTKAPKLGFSECIELLNAVKNNQELDRKGEELLRTLKEDRESILEKDPNVLIGLIQKVGDLIDSEYYEDILKVAPHGGEDSPLKSLLDILSDEGRLKIIMKYQNKLFSVIKIISRHGDVQYRTECLRFIIIEKKFCKRGNRSSRGRSFVSNISFEWSEEYLSTVKDLLDQGADPSWIPEELKKERYERTTAQNGFFGEIFVNLWEKNGLHQSLLQVLPLMLSKKCNSYEILPTTLLHGFLGFNIGNPRWDYIATNLESMPCDFFRQFQNILREILIHDGTLLVQKDCNDGRTPLQCFLWKIRLDERIFGEVREIIQMLQTPEVLSSQDNNGRTALHSLAIWFPVIEGEVTQSGRESFLDLVKSFANESNVGCQDEDGLTALHRLAWKFPGGKSKQSREISEVSREVYQDFVKHLSTYDILEMKDNGGRTALHYLADGFTFEIEDWAMETFVEVLKCLAVPRTIRIKDNEGETDYGDTFYGETALEMISRKWGKEVPEHYKDKFKEIFDILSGNN